MLNWDSSEEDKALKSVGLELMFLTREKHFHDDGITAVELAKLVSLPLDIVKKKLKILADAEIILIKNSATTASATENPRFLPLVLLLFSPVFSLAFMPLIDL